MAKGQARIVLHSRREFLIRSLRELMTLSDMKRDLERHGVQVSVSSLYRYMISDLGDDYAEYLWHTGRGLLRSRQDKSRRCGMRKIAVENLADINYSKITNPSSLKKFLTENK